MIDDQLDLAYDLLEHCVSIRCRGPEDREWKAIELAHKGEVIHRLRLIECGEIEAPSGISMRTVEEMAA